MRTFTDERNEHSDDQLWFLEHLPVFTQGQAGRPEHLLDAHDIPVIQSDRGGQITYHGPGQLIVYTLLDIRRHHCGIRTLVSALENSIIDTLLHWNIAGTTDRNAPGVYVNQKKIASIGLRVRRGCAYHGLSFNVNMNLTPFQYINPCGYTQLQMTQLQDQGGPNALADVTPILEEALQHHLAQSFYV
jgi:lipoyl(octanoyl) transferase